MLPIAPRPCIVADFLLPHLVHTVSFTALLSSHPEEESAERSPHLFRPAVMGLYVERRCIRSGRTLQARTRPQPSRQGMPEPAGTQKRQRKSRWESTSFLLTKHIFLSFHRFSAVCAFTGKQKRDQPTASLQSVSPIQTVIITQR